MPFVYSVILDGEIVETLDWGCGCGCIMAAYDYARDVQFPSLTKKYGEAVKMRRDFLTREEYERKLER